MADDAASATDAEGCAFGFDVGSKRIGVAVGHRLVGGARGLAVIGMREGAPDWDALDRLRGEWLPGALVVGLPLTLDGGEQPATRLARRVADALRARYRLPVLLVDERHSSQEAATRFARARAEGQRRRADAAQLDAAAAAVILERWFADPAATFPATPVATVPRAMP